ncbi:DUF4439 domain-containing protein [Parenemella sanctibonifatiensis]|uniref:DUF4439 domain-containing protein n=1 Tax=Parenemella sanctibonifatiensis TaxID=2016505 RepID=A0A255EFN4_9ACTN|nr:DUF4439 domain-containing protein [Parenemella sanctibonifatiensis]OYN88242.1 hypothetical protein CGZ92_04660 [Parenemella sanctibonifatiensis]
MLTRRALLWTGLAAATLSGCAVSEPRVSGSPQPVPTPDPQALAASAIETELAALCHAAGSEWAPAGAAYTARAWALSGPEPLARRGLTHSPAPSTPTTDRTLAGALRAAAESGRERALEHGGLLRLLYASAAAFSAGALSALPAAPSVALRDRRQPDPPQVNAEQALADVVRQLHALIAVLQPAIPVATSETAQVLRPALSAARQLRDDLTLALVEAGAEAPAAAPAYTLPELRTPDQARQAGADGAAALLPWVGRWVMTAEDPSEAIAGLAHWSAISTTLGGALPVWPGYPPS